MSKTFFDHVIHGQVWEGKDIWLYAPFYQNPERKQITKQMIVKAKRLKKYYILGASMPFIDEDANIYSYVEYGGYEYLYKVPVKEAYLGLPGYGDHLLKFYHLKGVGTYNPRVYMFLMDQLYNKKSYEHYFNYVKINSIGCMLPKYRRGQDNFFVVNEISASQKKKQWVWDFQKSIEYQISFINSSRVPELEYSSNATIGWKDWRLVRDAKGNHLDTDYIKSKLVYDILQDLLAANDKLVKKIKYNENQVFAIIGNRLKSLLLTHKTYLDKNLYIPGLNTMSILHLKKRLKSHLKLGTSVTSTNSEVLRFPDLGSEETRILLSVDADYGWLRKSRYLYIASLSDLRFSFKTHALSAKVTVKRNIFKKGLYPFVLVV